MTGWCNTSPLGWRVGGLVQGRFTIEAMANISCLYEPHRTDSPNAVQHAAAHQRIDRPNSAAREVLDSWIKRLMKRGRRFGAAPCRKGHDFFNEWEGGLPEEECCVLNCIRP